MKIIQLLARIEGSGVTKYVTELNKALITIGHNVEIIYINPYLDNGNTTHTGLTIDNCNLYDWGSDTIEHLNSADLVIVNSIIDKKSSMRNTWIDLIINCITTKKVIVINDHKVQTFTSYYGDLLKNKDFWLSFDKICTFSYNNKVYEKIRNLIGEELATIKYMHLMHPYFFNDDIKNTWKQNRLKRICYLGRHATFKDNVRLLRGRDNFWKHNYELEMRGIRPVMNVITIPYFKYVLDEQGKPVEKVPYVRGDKYELSPYTYWCDDGKKWRTEHGYDSANNDPLVNIPREKDRIYIFGSYKNNEGLEILSNYAFGCNFYNLDNSNCYGDNWEYVCFEMIEHGVIPLFDYNAGSSIYPYINGIKQDKSFAESGYGIFIKKDLSNVENCLDLMDNLYNNKYEYNKFIEKLYNVYKEHTNPIAIAKQFINEIGNN